MFGLKHSACVVAASWVFPALLTVFVCQVCPAGSGPRRSASGVTPGPGAGGGHAGAAGQGGGVLQPGTAAGSCGGDPGAAGQDDLPAGER